MHSPCLLLNAITALTHDKLYLAGHAAISKIKRPEHLKIKIKTHDHVKWWNSIFTGMTVITNRITPSHRDSGGSFPWYDLLFSTGTHREAYLHLDDIGAKLLYDPGTVTLVCGKVLSHSLPEWLGGERICIACFMRNMVHHRLDIYHAEWSMQGAYTRLMNKTFTFEQGWTTKRSHDYVEE
jgi:hypothetical protein